ncbi:MAG: BrnT family toxin [Pseudomonadota bacterium]
MKIYSWSSEKNEKLIEERGISFEDIILNIELGNVIEIYDHPNQDKYPGQMILAIEVEDYVYLVPFIEGEAEIFLKTIIPSRKATKRYR